MTDRSFPRDPPITDPPIRLAVLISGTGTTLENFVREIAAGRLRAEIALVVASRPGVRGIEIAEGADLPVAVLPRREFDSVEAFSRTVFDRIRAARVDLVAMAGFLSLIQIPDDFAGRVMNIHPALLPEFGGKGYYGHRVHEAVLEASAAESGCTVHFADNQYDHGPVILKRRVPVEPGDTPDTLAARVFQEECRAYPEAVRLYAAGKLHVEDDRVEIG